MFDCNYCDKSFKNQRGLSIHIDVKHPIEKQQALDLQYENSEYKCSRCGYATNTYESLRKHNSQKHKIPSQDFYVEFYLNGEYPTCKCGCREKTTWKRNGFRDYIKGHHVKGKGFQTDEGIKKSVDKRKKMWANGELVQHTKGKTWEELHGPDVAKQMKLDISNNTERSAKISKALTGKPKSPEHIKKIQKDRKRFWSIQENRDKQRLARIKYHTEKIKKSKTKLEILFMEILDNLKIPYHEQFPVDGYLYDIKVKNSNILIEVDGDFYHCNPAIYSEAKYDIQKHTIEHDKIKNQVAIDNEYILLRFWEHDVKNHPAKVIKRLLKELEI